MNLLHLQYFHVVAREQGFTRASRVLRVQQPALSRMVRLLEENLGFPLFERIGRGIRLTPQGEEVFRACERIFGEVEGLRAQLGRISGECKGPLAFAGAEVVVSHLVPRVLPPLLRRHPKIHPAAFSGPSSLLFERIIQGELEFGLFFHVPDLPERLDQEDFIACRFHLVVRRGFRRNPSVLESFIGSREVDDTSTRRFPTVERLRRDRPRTRITISSNSLTAHRSLVLAGQGVSILPAFLVEGDLASGRLEEVDPKERFEFPLRLVRRKNAALSLNARAFLDELRGILERGNFR